MEERGGYGQFCPVAMASEILCTRWTMLVLRELLVGTTRFNDLWRGVPRMSPALLSKRLKELEKAGVVVARPNTRGVMEYRLSEAGQELGPIIISMGCWGQRWIDSEITLRNLDPSLLMWDIRRNLDPTPMPERRCTIQFQYSDLPESRRNWWLVIEDGKVDLCYYDPGHEIDLLVRGPLRSMTAVWMGLTSLPREVDEGNLEIDGEPSLACSMQKWLGASTFAKEPRRAV